MILVLKIFFFSSLFLLVQSYIFYPIHLLLLYKFSSRKKSKNLKSDQTLPFISCITSVYNEEAIIGQKLHTVLTSDYPKEKLAIYVGSDASLDQSNQIIEEFCKMDSRIHFYPFSIRRGKTNVINDLMDVAFEKHPKTNDHIILFTDANVMLDKNTIRQLSTNFYLPNVALVDSRIVQRNLMEDGISFSENKYMTLETHIKWMEGLVWGKMMGAFGGCFAIRSVYLEKIPPSLIVDDFYISMNALIKGGICLVDENAICYEGIPNQIFEEFKRKSRISIGNFQNLAIFYNLMFNQPWQLAYAFVSHKLIRWIGPILLLIVWLSSVFIGLLQQNIFLEFFMVFSFVMLGLPVLDLMLSQLGIHIKILRGLRYFFIMNLALLNGFILYLTGKQKSSWQPPKRSSI